MLSMERHIAESGCAHSILRESMEAHMRMALTYTGIPSSGGSLVNAGAEAVAGALGAAEAVAEAVAVGVADVARVAVGADAVNVKLAPVNPYRVYSHAT